MDTKDIEHGVAGIYLITNLVNKKIYVGSSACMKYRWSNHRSYFRAGNHHNPKLQKAWNKYGEVAFTCTVLEIVEDKDRLAAVEQTWIDRLDATNRATGYNILPLAYRQIRVRASEECVNCKRKAKPLRNGRCKTCYEYLRRRNVERPYVVDGRQEKSAETDKNTCPVCGRPVTIVGRPVKGFCQSCYTVQWRRSKETK